jgi:hypothetical protein
VLGRRILRQEPHPKPGNERSPGAIRTAESVVLSIRNQQTRGQGLPPSCYSA